MIKVIYVGLGGALGSVLRYGVNILTQDWTERSGFPLGTLIVNIIGCFVIGLLSGLADSRGTLTTEARAFLMVGLLGGFTTFSAFSNESIALLRAGSLVMAIVNITASVVLGLVAVWAGRSVVQYVG